jgi:hypothetical protein
MAGSTKQRRAILVAAGVGLTPVSHVDLIISVDCLIKFDYCASARMDSLDAGPRRVGGEWTTY